MFSDEEESTMRARFLMSPYNLQEARRRRHIRDTFISAGVLAVFGVCSYVVYHFILL